MLCLYLVLLVMQISFVHLNSKHEKEQSHLSSFSSQPQLFSHISPPSPAVFFIHGTFGSQSAWYKPGGDFFEAIAQAIKKGEAQEWDIHPQALLIPFTWSGKWSHTARLKAGRELAQLLLHHDCKAIIAHSEGCSVATIACQLLSREALCGDLFEQMMIVEDIVLESFLSNGDMAGPFAYPVTKHHHQETHRVREIAYTSLLQIQQEWKERRNMDKRVPPFFYEIPYAFYFGAPVRSYQHHPPFSCMKKLIHFFAYDDPVQTLGGTIEATFPLNEHTLNIAVKFAPGADKKANVRNAHHCSLHSAHVGKWLFSLPYFLNDREKAQQASATFEKKELFSALGKNYEVIFFENGDQPEVQCIGNQRPEKKQMFGQKEKKQFETKEIAVLEEK